MLSMYGHDYAAQYAAELVPCDCEDDVTTDPLVICAALDADCPDARVGLY